MNKPMRLTDSAVICRFMGWILDAGRCPICGWPFAANESEGCTPPDNCSQRPAPVTRADALPTLTLDRCHEVEARLSDEQWGAYGIVLAEILQSTERKFARGLIHATAKQKIAALAAVLRSEVEKQV